MSGRRLPLIVGLLALCVAASACGLPPLRERELRSDAIAQTSFLYAADGTLITELHAGENRIVVDSSEIPQTLRDAVVAVEDQRFYQHRGIDLKALLRAAYVDAISGRVVEGGSTITQQYVKNAFVGTERTLERKIKEAVVALQVENAYSKGEILTRYLNTVYFGRGAYGVQAAAQAYFSRDASALTLARSALLASIIQSPSAYDPFVFPERAIARRNATLRTMRDQQMITDAELARAERTPLRLRPEVEQDRYLAPYFVDFFERWFLSNPAFGKSQQERYDLLFRGGLRIRTTLVPRLQAFAEEAVSSVLTYRSDPRAAMTVIDPRTGQVVAMVGGRDYFSDTDRFARLNLALGGSTGRQAGSSFKPFALVAALENGISPADTFRGWSTTIPLDNGTAWTPDNYEGSSYGYVSMESATVNSVNVAYVEIERALGRGNIYEGAQRVVSTARRMGVRCCTRTTVPDTPLQATPSAVLGTNEVNTLEMASAYGTLAAGGYRVEPTPVTRITDPSGKVLYSSEPEPKPVVDPRVAVAAVDVLSKVVDYGTGYLADIDRPQFGKTGTAQDWSDAWFVGAIPQLVAAVWVGFPQEKIPMCCGRVRLYRVTGGSWPTEIWRAFMSRAVERYPERDFPGPQTDFVSVEVDVTQDPVCLPNEFTPPGNIETRDFVVGTQPTKTCTEPASAQVVTVPSVVGLAQARAEQLLRDTGFYTQVEATTSSSQPPGTVVGQTPGAGVDLQQTAVVTITVAVRPGAD